MREGEDGCDKIALDADEGFFTHVARQLVDGRCTSKLGSSEDIVHPSADDLAGELYGDVHCVMRGPSA